MPLPNSSPTPPDLPETPGDNGVPTLEPLFDKLIKKALTNVKNNCNDFHNDNLFECRVGAAFRAYIR